MAHEKIIVIEDEADIREVITHNFSREGYSVDSASDGESGLALVKAKGADIVLLDLMLPGLDGIEICRQLKADPMTRSTPIIMVTAKGEESDVVLGLGIGADDYVIKPFSPKELLARVKAVLRRGPLIEDQSNKERIICGDVVVDSGRHEVQVEGNKMVFTATEFRLLHFLASHPGRVFTRNHLLNRITREDAFVIDRNIDVHIQSVRKKLGIHKNMIETIRGVGYRFKDEEE
jgi:two-component system alkaline phosphatase synthesis response regulator PhoP